MISLALNPTGTPQIMTIAEAIPKIEGFTVPEKKITTKRSVPLSPEEKRRRARIKYRKNHPRPPGEFRERGTVVDVSRIPFERGSREYFAEYQRRYRTAIRTEGQ